MMEFCNEPASPLTSLALLGETVPHWWPYAAVGVAPAVFLIALELWKGHVVELRPMLRAAVLFPLAAGLPAGYASRALESPLASTVTCAGDLFLFAWLGVFLTSALLVPARLAVRRARRLRKPLSPAPAS